MSFRTAPFGSCAAFTLLVLSSANAIAAHADAYVPPRTAWEHPEIQGLFASNTEVPFERSVELGEKEFFTEAEYKARLSATPAPAGTVKNLRTSLITYPSNGRLPPLTPEAQRRREAAGAQHVTPEERCTTWPHEGPPLRPLAWNTHVQIMQTPQLVIFMTQQIHDTRVIPLAPARPEFGGIAGGQGNAWGRWEGDTLVIETRGNPHRVTPAGSGAGRASAATIIEKFTRTDARTIRYQFEVSDPGLWQSRWGGEFPMELTEGPMLEYACQKDNGGTIGPSDGRSLFFESTRNPDQPE